MRKIKPFGEFINESLQATPEITEFCKANGMSVQHFFGELPIGRGNGRGITTTTIPGGFSANIEGSLAANSAKEINGDFTPTVSGNLYMRGIKSLPKGFSPSVGGDIMLPSLESVPEGFDITVGGNMDLDSVVFIPSGFSPTVGENLWLNGLTLIPPDFSPKVGNDLYITGLSEFPIHMEWMEGINGEIFVGKYGVHTKISDMKVEWIPVE